MVQPAASSAPFPAGIVFLADPAAAGRRIAGVTAIGRVVREIALAGITQIHLVAPKGADLGPEALEDFARLAPDASVKLVRIPPENADAIGFASDYLVPAEEIARFAAGKARELCWHDEPVAWRLAGEGRVAAADALPFDHRIGWELLLRTVKSGDGLVSRWINRRISRPISAFLLQFRAIRPLHATIGTALIGIAMVIALLTGSYTGMVWGAILFQFASIFDGVDGEIARVTFRSSVTGASLDSAIDMATNILFIVGLTYSLTMQGVHVALYLGIWSLSAMSLGLWLIGRRTVKTGKPLGFDLVKHKMREGNFGGVVKAIIAFFTFLTARDGFAFLFALLVASGLALVALSIFASVALVWIVTVIVTVVPRPSLAEPAEEATSVL